MNQTLWQCAQIRAGQVYKKLVFNTEAEALRFKRQMGRVEPDGFWRIEPVEARMIWN